MGPRRAAAIAAAIVAAAAVAHADEPRRRGRIEVVEHTPLDDAPTRGHPDAPVTVEVYLSVGNDLSNQAYLRAMRLWRRHPGRVRVVFRPLVRSDFSALLSPIAIAAHVHGRFFELMDAIAARSGPPATREDALDLAVQAGLDRAVASAALEDNAGIRRILEDNDRRAVRARISQRADLVLNGRPLGPMLDDDSLEARYKAELVLARIELAAGAPPRAVPALAARRARCAELRDRAQRRGRGRPEDDDEVLTAVAGWHLGGLLRDGTGCLAPSPPTGRVDPSYDFDEVRRPEERTSLLAAPLSTDGLPSVGPADAPVVIQVVCNLSSSSCGDQLDRAHRTMQRAWPLVRVVYRPWVDLLLEDAALRLPLAEQLLCAERLGDGWRFLWSLVHGGDALDTDRAAARAGVAPDAFAACADQPPAAARRVVEEARAAGISFAPTVVVGQRAYVGGLTDDRPLLDLVELELAPGLLGGTADAAGDPILDDWARTIPPYVDAK